jgi:hypothetical protein
MSMSMSISLASSGSISLASSGRFAEIPKPIIQPDNIKQSKVKPVDAKAKAYVEELLASGKIKLGFHVPKDVDEPSLKLAVKDALVQLAETKQGRRILDDASPSRGLTIWLDGTTDGGSYSNGYIQMNYKMFLEQAYLVNGLTVLPLHGVFTLAHELVHAVEDSKQLGLSDSDNENYAITETDKFVKEYNEKWGTKYPMREVYGPGWLVYVGNGDLFSGSTVADSAPKAVAARYKEFKSLGLAYTLKEQLDRLDGLYMYKFSKSLPSATTSKEPQAKAAFVKLQTLVDELSAKETKGPLTPQEVASALAAFELHRANFLKALK